MSRSLEQIREDRRIADQFNGYTLTVHTTGYPQEGKIGYPVARTEDGYTNH